MSSWSIKEYIVALLTALLVCTAIAVLTISREQYAGFITHSVAEGLKENGVLMTTTGATLEGTGIKAEELSLFFPQALTTVALNDAHLRLSLPRLLLLQKDLTLHAKAYRGITLGNFRNSGSNWSGSLSSRNIQLQDHPQLQALGLSSGDLSIDIPRFESNHEGLKAMEATLLLQNLSKPEVSTFFLPPGIVPSSLAPFLRGKATIPPFSSIGLKGIARFEEEELSVHELEIASPAGSLKVSGSIKGIGGTPNAALKGVVNLTDKGVAEAGAFLPLITRNVISSKTKSFKIELSGALTAQNIRFAPCKGNECSKG